MKNVTKILTAAILCAALFASTQRTDALGGNAAFWPGDEANIAAFPAQLNNHAYVQLTGVGDAGAGVNETAAILFNHEGTTWGFDWSSAENDWFSMKWGNGDMGVSFGMINSSDGADGIAEDATTGHRLGWGKGFSFGEIGVTMDSWTVTTGADPDSDDYVAETFVCTGGNATGNEADETACDATTGVWTGQDDMEGEAAHDAFDTDTNNMNINFRKDCGFWIFDTMVAGYSSAETGLSTASNDAETHITVDMVSHMNAGAADVVFAMGLDMGDTGATDGATNTLTSALGVEANMTDWATARVGVNYDYDISSDTDATANDWSWAWGLGFNWGDFTADFTVNDDILSTPIHTISGHQGGGITDDSGNKSLTLTYSF